MPIPLLIAIAICALVVLVCLAFTAWNISGRNAAIKDRDAAKLSLADVTKLLTAAQLAEVAARQRSDQINELLGAERVENARLTAQVRAHESGGDRIADMGRA